jgi:hypothetical protein
MAQTKRKRKTKHRGNAAGMIENRGRTGRPGGPTAPGGPKRKLTPEQKRIARFERPPTWAGATTRAVFASLIFGVLLILLFGQDIGPAIALTGFMFLLYIPLGYATDSVIYKRRMKKKAESGGGR